MSRHCTSVMNALALMLALAAPALAHGDRGKKPEPLSIKEQGSFYVNGELVTIQFPCGTSQPPIPNYCAPGDIANNPSRRQALRSSVPITLI